MVERQHRIDQDRFFNYLRMYSQENGRCQFAEYQGKSNDYIQGIFGMKSPNQVIEIYPDVM